MTAEAMCDVGNEFFGTYCTFNPRRCNQIQVTLQRTVHAKGVSYLMCKFTYAPYIREGGLFPTLRSTFCFSATLRAMRRGARSIALTAA